MTKVKSPYDDDVVKAMEEGTDLPEGTILNFYTPGKFDNRSVEDLVANATQNNPPKPGKQGSKSTSREPVSGG